MILVDDPSVLVDDANILVDGDGSITVSGPILWLPERRKERKPTKEKDVDLAVALLLLE